MYSRRACTAVGRGAALLITNSAIDGVEPADVGRVGVSEAWPVAPFTDRCC
jgi:hypothetical protein